MPEGAPPLDATATERQRRFYEAIAAISDDLGQAFDEAALLTRVCQVLVQTGVFDGAWIGTPRPDGLFQPQAIADPVTAAYLAEISAMDGSALRPLPHGCIECAWASGEPVVENDWTHAGWTAQLRASSAASRQWGASAVLPIRRDGRLWGIVVVYSRAAQCFDAALLPLGARLARGIGAMLDHQDQRRRLRHLRLFYAALTDVAEIVQQTPPEAGEVALAQALADALPANPLFGSVTFVRLEADGALHTLASGGDGKHLRVRRPGEPGGEGSTLRAWRLQQPVYLHDAEADPTLPERTRAYLRRIGARSLLSLPLRRAGVPWGVMTCARNEVSAFPPDTRELATRLVRLIEAGLDSFHHDRTLAAARERADWLASHDALTGLLNRAGLDTLLPAALERARREQRSLALAFLDLDGFKPINDRHGHEVGDRVLASVAARLLAGLRAQDRAVRLGGDEFVLLIQDTPEESLGEAALTRLFDRLAECLAAPIVLDGLVLTLGCSCGVACYDGDDTDGPTLLRRADLAMYAHKQSEGQARPSYVLHRDGMVELGMMPLRAHGLADMLAAGALRLRFQPWLDLAAGRLTSVEALARLEWGGRVLGPAEFFPGLDHADLALLGQRVRAMALAQGAAWQRAGLACNISVNVSPEELLDPRFATQVLASLAAEPDFPAGRLTIELLETSEILNRTLSSRHLRQLRAAGVRVALDDLGSGYSSLLRLKELPVDIIKIDQSFVRGLLQRPGDLKFLHALISLARSVQAEIVVEGVETPLYLAALRQMGVDYLQGYAIARPLTAPAVPAALREFRLDPVSPPHPLIALGEHLRWLAWVESGLAAYSDALSADPVPSDRWEIARLLAAHSPATLAEHAAIARYHAAALRAASAGLIGALERAIDRAAHAPIDPALTGLLERAR
jgi:diguanylate cyclase (GGDEF)-like protein